MAGQVVVLALGRARREGYQVCPGNGLSLVGFGGWNWFSCIITGYSFNLGGHGGNHIRCRY